MTTAGSLVESLRTTLNPSTGKTSDTRFQFGTETGSNYIHWSDGYNYKALPKQYGKEDAGAVERPHVVFPKFNPRLRAYPDEIRAKLRPVAEDLHGICQRLDVADSGFLSNEKMEEALDKCGQFLSKEERSMLLMLSTRNVKGQLDYNSMIDAIQSDEEVCDLGPTLGATASAALLAPSVPEVYSYDYDAPLTVSLRLHPSSDPYDVPAAKMKRYASQLTLLRKHENHGEKLRDLMRHFLLDDLLLMAGRANPELSFRQWLMYSGVMARTTMPTDRTVVAPEVYEVFDQIIAALGMPPVSSAVMTATEFGASLRHTSRTGLPPP